VLLASRIPFWRQALLIVQPETLLRWHRDAFRPRPSCAGIGSCSAASGAAAPNPLPRRTGRPSRPRRSPSSARWPRPTGSGAPSASGGSCSVRPVSHKTGASRVVAA
jgi:hypothetical protein